MKENEDENDDIGFGPQDDGYDPEKGLEKFRDIGDELKRCSEMQERFNRSTDKLMESVDNRIKMAMYDYGDFDPRHYKVVKTEKTFSAPEGMRTDISVEVKYVGKPEEKRKAVKILKTIYGKKFFYEKAFSLHRKLSYIVDQEELGEMLDDNFIKDIIG